MSSLTAAIGAALWFVAVPLQAQLWLPPACLPNNGGSAPRDSARVLYDPSSSPMWSLDGVALGQRIDDIEKVFPDQWRRSYSDEAGLYISRWPRSNDFSFRVIAATGTAIPNDGRVRDIFAWVPLGAASPVHPGTLAATLDLVWGTAIRFENAPHDRLWIDRKKGVTAQLTIERDEIPRAVIRIAQCRVKPPDSTTFAFPPKLR